MVQASPTKEREHMAFTDTSDSHVIDVEIDQSVPINERKEIDLSVVKEVVKQKDIDQLREYGGAEGLARRLRTNLEHGITGDEEDIRQRIKTYGSNTYRSSAKNLFYFVWEALRDPTHLFLQVCAALSLGLNIKKHGLKEGWYNGGNICFGLFPAIAIIAIRNFRQNRQFDKLIKASNNIQVDVARNRRQQVSNGRQQVSIFDIVVGDVVYLKIGDQVPADGLFIYGDSLLIDESSMTGESDHVKVDLTQNPFLFSGTKVTGGNGRMLVTSVGMNTKWGEMMSKAPLKFRLNKVTSSIEKVVLCAVFLANVILLILDFTGKSKDKNGNTEYNGSKTLAVNILNSVVGILSLSVTILDDAIPGGLPVAVTLAEAKSTKQMMSDLTIVGKRSACETMGFTTTICINKTGTLTLDQMKVKKFWIGQKSIEESGTSSVAATVVELLHQGTGLNTTGSVNMSASGSDVSPAEKAILSWVVDKGNFDMEGLKQSCENLHVEPFNSNQTSGVLMRKSGQNTINLHIKGEAKMVLERCFRYYDVSGTPKNLNPVEKERFHGIIDGMEASGLRCIAFAHKQVPDEENEKREPRVDKFWILLGLVGLTDPCMSLKETVQAFQSAGVKVKMFTRNDTSTAEREAKECGILSPEEDMGKGVVVNEAQFRRCISEKGMEEVDKICVMAKPSPESKSLMVQCLKLKGHVVAVIEDGTNDTPALKEADISISMGRQATEVAKACSDIIILDDNFVSVARIFRRGRCVCTNIRRFIQLQLTGNIVALLINFITSVSTGEVALSAVQLVWVNLIMNISGALALATEKPTEELMEKKTVVGSKQLLTNVMWMNLLFQALYQTAVLLILRFKVSAHVSDTLIFNVFVLCQVFNAFALWKPEKKNVFEEIYKTKKWFLLMIGVVIVLQVVMVQFLKFMDTERLNWWQWGVCVGLAFFPWLIKWAVKWIQGLLLSTPSKLDPTELETSSSSLELETSSSSLELATTSPDLPLELPTSSPDLPPELATSSQDLPTSSPDLPLNWWQWGVCVGLAFFYWLIEWAVKCIPVPEGPFLSDPSFSSTPSELDPTELETLSSSLDLETSSLSLELETSSPDLPPELPISSQNLLPELATTSPEANSSVRAPSCNTEHRSRPAGKDEQSGRCLPSFTEASTSSSRVASTLRERENGRGRRGVERERVEVDYIQHLPEAFQQYMSHTKNVKADGHCGFRAIAAQIGYTEKGWARVRKDLIQEIHQNKDLYDELYGQQNWTNELLQSLNYFQKPAPEANWMDCMSLGIVIASAYNIVLHTFDENVRVCYTHLPLRSPPVPAQQRQEIAIARIGNHFVQLFLHPYYPVPPIPTWWWKYASDEAKGWAFSYKIRLHLWFHILGDAPGPQFGGNIN